MPKEENRPSYMDPKIWKRIQKKKDQGHKYTPPSADPEYVLGEQLTRAGIPYEREIRIPLNTHECNYAKVDFLIQGWLVVEIDGPSHLSKEQKDFDMRKTLALGDRGHTVLRVNPEQVFGSKALRLIGAKMIPYHLQKRMKYLLNEGFRGPHGSGSP
jgi:hypothetical protein